MELKERIQKIKEIMSYIDDISYYTLEPKPISANNLYTYLENIKKEFKRVDNKKWLKNMILDLNKMQFNY